MHFLIFILGIKEIFLGDLIIAPTQFFQSSALSRLGMVVIRRGFKMSEYENKPVSHLQRS